MVKQNTGNREQIVGLPVVDRNIVSVDLGDTIRRARIERRCLRLRHLQHASVHLRRACLIETDICIDRANRFQYLGNADCCELCGQNRLRPGCRHERLCGKIVNFVRLRFPQRLNQRILVQQVGLQQMNTACQMGDSLKVFGAGAAHDPIDRVAFGEQKFRKVRAVLSGNTRYKGGFSIRRDRIHIRSRWCRHRQILQVQEILDCDTN